MRRKRSFRGLEPLPLEMDKKKKKARWTGVFGLGERFRYTQGERRWGGDIFSIH